MKRIKSNYRKIVGFNSGLIVLVVNGSGKAKLSLSWELPYLLIPLSIMNSINGFGKESL